jgi:hypothetical protein
VNASGRRIHPNSRLENNEVLGQARGGIANVRRMQNPSAKSRSLTASIEFALRGGEAEFFASTAPSIAAGVPRAQPSSAGDDASAAPDLREAPRVARKVRRG